MKVYEAVSVCSGAMGQDLGFEATGRVRLVAAVERDKHCCDTIRINRDAGRVGPGLRLYHADLERLDPQAVMADLGLRPGELPILVGSPPCQAFSWAGKRRGSADPRGLVSWQYLWWLEALRPAVFVAENVPGLLTARASGSHAKGSLLARWADDLPAGYRLDVVRVNAADYGVPQFRDRIFLIGNRLGLAVQFPAPTHGPPGSALAPWRTVRDALNELPEGDAAGLAYSERDRRIYDLVPPGGNWRSLPQDFALTRLGRACASNTGGRTGWWHRLSWDEPSPALLTRPNRSREARCHPHASRPLSVAEYARIQCFPGGWVFSGPVSERYRQIGNAVPPPLGAAAGVAAVRLLDEAAAGGGEAASDHVRFLDTRTCRRRPKRKTVQGANFEEG
jgi:DNA (cytosine-5)-methyltransferase 1